MYLWKINKLKATLASTGLSQNSCFYYLLIWGVSIVGGMELMAYYPYETINIWRRIITAGYLIVAIVGTYLFYQANGGTNGKDLFDRYMSIGFVVFIRLIPVMFLLIILLSVFVGVTEGFDENYMNKAGPAEAFITLFWISFVWYRMIIHVKDVANAK
ncbi:hypothetical protein [Pleionea sediminis]|uniref:hypothetical protein n=1 Tax=Pleionea sediminis TaxID=2569479 RepID=UPI001184C7FC|nr:hypothetical protein [Pleionea sediminis]